jgi:hypothetical protein
MAVAEVTARKINDRLSDAYEELKDAWADAIESAKGVALSRVHGEAVWLDGQKPESMNVRVEAARQASHRALAVLDEAADFMKCTGSRVIDQKAQARTALVQAMRRTEDFLLVELADYIEHQSVHDPRLLALESMQEASGLDVFVPSEEGELHLKWHRQEGRFQYRSRHNDQMDALLDALVRSEARFWGGSGGEGGRRRLKPGRLRADR